MDRYLNRVTCADCLDVLKELPDNSVDLVVTDPPYGITSCDWDIVPNLTSLWQELTRIGSPLCSYIFTASQPFTTDLISSNRQQFKHEWIWIKNMGSNFANTVREPMKEHESIIVFANKKWTYNKQMQDRTGGGLERSKYLVEHNTQERKGTRTFEGRKHHEITKQRVPSSWQKFNVERGKHPTQKPVALMSYLIKTYSNENEIVLDPFLGSGTTAVACKHLRRNWIGVELNNEYCEMAEKRIKETLIQEGIFK